MIFSAYHPTCENEIWKSDGPDAGTVLIKDIYAETQSFSGTF
ncbi:MAG: hypothetical protein H7329_05915 [Opitutaceae bacterium]|nr:hypothetical protein [Cytophagales bacterium]